MADPEYNIEPPRIFQEDHVVAQIHPAIVEADITQAQEDLGLVRLDQIPVVQPDDQVIIRYDELVMPAQVTVAVGHNDGLGLAIPDYANTARASYFVQHMNYEPAPPEKDPNQCELPFPVEEDRLVVPVDGPPSKVVKCSRCGKQVLFIYHADATQWITDKEHKEGRGSISLSPEDMADELDVCGGGVKRWVTAGGTNWHNAVQTTTGHMWYDPATNHTTIY